MAIETDGATYHSSETARARDRLRQEHLERLGWTFLRIWSTDYFRNPDGEILRAMLAYENAVKRSDEGSVVEMVEIDESPSIDSAVSTRRKPMPCTSGLTIGQYSDAQLIRVVTWVASDGLIRTDEELLTDTMQSLGFKRRGSVVSARIEEAVARFRQNASR